MAKKSDDNFSDNETKRRMEAALRGARVTGHKAMSDISPKRNLGKVAKKSKAKKKPGK
ncbi:MAG: hypothetical protein AB7T86_12450 [Xanthobacteraceae bacterium]|uniref:hypothetical protein n=1 Tax=Pseudolabrys sp. TaxID=1960880 RepID=UPI003D125B08